VRRCVEVIVSTFIDRRFRRRARRHRSRRDNILLSAHSLVDQVGQVVEAAGVLTLVLNHIVETHADRARLFQTA
jgi:ribonuclease BN (tRNA processing enzyme)